MLRLPAGSSLNRRKKGKKWSGEFTMCARIREVGRLCEGDRKESGN